MIKFMRYTPSCPSRGTWIEMTAASNMLSKVNVVPLAGHVD